jgi:transaldolase
MGIIRGVTTNPTIMVRDGVSGGIAGIKRNSIEIANLIAPYPVSVEVMSNDPKKMELQAIEFSQWANNIVIKIPIHGPSGELDNVPLIHKLKDRIRINATAMMSAQQCLLAALAGATYVSIFGGRVNNMGYNACLEIKKARNMLDRLKLDMDPVAKLVAGSTREVLNVIEWLEAGADIVCVTPQLLEGMLIHPYSKETVQMFLRDAEKI